MNALLFLRYLADFSIFFPAAMLCFAPVRDHLKFPKHFMLMVLGTAAVCWLGFSLLGAAFGILLSSKGYGPVWAFLMALIIYAGSGQFVGVGLLVSGFHPLTAFFMTLVVNARHIFYGISMLERFRDFGRAKWYMIFSLTDEPLISDVPKFP